MIEVGSGHPTRMVFVDTETTGLSAAGGDRIIEIAAIEWIGRKPTGRTFHQMVSPERAINEGARAIHGISDADLVGKPLFREIAADFIEFVRGAELIAHNASFDVRFIDKELEIAGRSERLSGLCLITDSLSVARRTNPGVRVSLDALCQRYGVDNSGRQFHGALLDAQLLGEVYMAMTAGQFGLMLDSSVHSSDAGPSGAMRRVTRELLIKAGAQQPVVRHLDIDVSSPELPPFHP